VAAEFKGRQDLFCHPEVCIIIICLDDSLAWGFSETFSKHVTVTVEHTTPNQCRSTLNQTALANLYRL
jgi:hypothetical protein